jgi:thiol-disulfide isomerase/thioredoxin
VLDNDTLRLSSFNGSMAHLFKAYLHDDSLVGRFWSGIHWSEPWVAHRDQTFRLRDPDSLTVLKEGQDMIDLRFMGLDDRPVSTTDATERNRPLLVQIMGSWCPNCADEAVLLDELYGKYHASGLDVIGIAFEKQHDPNRALASLRRFRDALGVDYPIAYAGEATKENTREQLPFLERIMSYPTCIFIDRQGKVRKVHTGFYGPGTGEFYLAYRRDLEAFVQQLIAETPGIAQVH